MTEDDRTGYSSVAEADLDAALAAPPRRAKRGGFFRRRPRRRRIRWLRVVLIGIPLLALALFSFVFGAVLGFVPRLSGLQHEIQVKFSNRGNGANSIVYSQDGHQLGILTAHNEFFLPPNDIPPIMAHAIVAIEDRRFYSEPGIDIRGIARAFVADVFGGATQGASTITEQFVKNALGAQYDRSILEKFKEAALAFQLSHRWRKPQILADYLDTAYFGSGAWGVEAAARAYFGSDPTSPLFGCGQTPVAKDPASLCVTNLTPDEAALLAALVNAPTIFNGLQNSNLARDRRDLVLRAMYQQGYLTQPELTQALQASLPTPQMVQSPGQADSDHSAGYFVSWVANTLTQHLGFGPGSRGRDVYTGGYHITTTLNWQLQQAAQAIVNHTLPPGSGGPAAALVALDNATGQVRAMVGGYDYNKNGFNLATQALRQPGSAWKVFDLAAALEHGYTPNTPVLSDPYVYRDPNPAFGVFSVSNDESGYFGADIPLWEALAVSDNTAFARVGLDRRVGTRLIAYYAKNMGITTTISINPSMVIGGLAIGVTPLDMAHAYETIANYGQLTTGSLVSITCAGDSPEENPKAYRWEETPPPAYSCPGPVGITRITRSDFSEVNQTRTQPVPEFSYATDQTEVAMMHKVLTVGTAQSAQIPGLSAWGKTGTTSNYVDAWFCGSTPRSGKAPSQTICVWVGYPKGAKSMAHDYGGKPVYGGTYPALIWKAYVEAMLHYYDTGSTGIGSSTAIATPTYSPPAPGSGGTATTLTTGATGTGTAQTGTTTPSGTTTTPPATGSTAGTTPPSTSATGAGGSTQTPPTPTTPTNTTPTTTTPPSTGGGGGVVAPGSGAGP
jgi:penicillin-binding protein 1A